MEKYPHKELTGVIIKKAYSVYNYLGFGFLESVYEKTLSSELKKHDLDIKHQVPIKVFYKKEKIGDFRADMIVNGSVIVEIKAVESLHERHEVQLINYLSATEIEIGLLINFGEKIEIKRKIFSNKRKKRMNRLP